MIGKHTVETVSVTQQTVALSSAEAGQYASFRAAAEALQTKTLHGRSKTHSLSARTERQFRATLYDPENSTDDPISSRRSAYGNKRRCALVTHLCSTAPPIESTSTTSTFWLPCMGMAANEPRPAHLLGNRHQRLSTATSCCCPPGSSAHELLVRHVPNLCASTKCQVTSISLVACMGKRVSSFPTPGLLPPTLLHASPAVCCVQDVCWKPSSCAHLIVCDGDIAGYKAPKPVFRNTNSGENIAPLMFAPVHRAWQAERPISYLSSSHVDLPNCRCMRILDQTVKSPEGG